MASSTLRPGRSTESSRRPASRYRVSADISSASAMPLSTWADGVYTPRSIWLRYGFETLARPASWRIESDISSRCVRMKSPTDLNGGVGSDMRPILALGEPSLGLVDKSSDRLVY